MPVALDPLTPAPTPPAGVESGQIGQNIAAVQGFYTREGQNRSSSQRRAEYISEFMGRLAFLIAILMFVAAWMGINGVLPALGRPAPDPAPFFWLQGVVGIAALLIEQKAAKLIDLMEELRRDLPNVANRHDPGAAEMQQALSPEAVLSALDAPAPALDVPPPV